MEAVTRRDLEVRGTTFLDGNDPGTVRTVWALCGEAGAVHFVFADWHPDADAELRKIDTKFMVMFGHPLMPMGMDVGYHSPAPMHETHLDLGPADEHCMWLDGKPCWADGSGMRARTWLAEWIARERDLDWLFEQLTGYYNAALCSDGEGPLEFAEMLATMLGLTGGEETTE